MTYRSSASHDDLNQQPIRFKTDPSCPCSCTRPTWVSEASVSTVHCLSSCVGPRIREFISRFRSSSTAYRACSSKKNLFFCLFLNDLLSSAAVLANPCTNHLYTLLRPRKDLIWDKSFGYLSSSVPPLFFLLLRACLSQSRGHDIQSTRRWSDLSSSSMLSLMPSAVLILLQYVSRVPLASWRNYYRRWYRRWHTATWWTPILHALPCEMFPGHSSAHCHARLPGQSIMSSKGRLIDVHFVYFYLSVAWTQSIRASPKESKQSSVLGMR